MMRGGQTDGASGGSSVASSSSRRTPLTLDVGCLEPFNPKGEPRSLSKGGRGGKEHF